MEIKWPEAGADFNKVIGGEIIRIIGSNNLVEEFYNYAVNFNKAAHIITEYVLNNPRISNLDIYFFALAYLYRHSIELILKAVAFQHIGDINERKNFLKNTRHSLSIIFDTITPFAKSQLDKDVEAYNWLVAYFNDVSEVDKESDSFRYPFGIQVTEVHAFFKKVKTYSIKRVFDEQKSINLVVFANKMEIVFNLIDGIYKGIFGNNFEYKNYKPTFLEEGGDYYSQSVIGYKYNSEEYYKHIKAYTECAEQLYKSINKEQRLKKTLFFPMCYLYRNAVELSLKRILFEESSFSIEETLKYMHNKKHSIHAIWKKIKDEIIKHADAPKNDKTIDNVERYITQLHNFDGASDKFRYPIDKHLQVYFSRQKKFDISNVNKFFLELLVFLDAVDGMMSEHNKWKVEMEAEYQSEIYNYYDPSDYYNC